MASAGSEELEYGAILVFQVSILIMAILIPLQINPEIGLDLPITIENQFIVMLALDIGAFGFIEAHAVYTDRKKMSFSSLVGIIVGVIGVGIGGFIIWTDYSYTDPELNRWFSYYLGLGALIIFILAKDNIFQHTAILKYLRRR